MITNKSQYLRFVPLNPVVFTYNSNNDSLPTVLVLKLLHLEENPGFLGINLDYIDPSKRSYFLKQYRNEFIIASSMGKEFVLDSYLKTLANGALRRYNYDSIGEFIYRGAKQNHEV